MRRRWLLFVSILVWLAACSRPEGELPTAVPLATLPQNNQTAAQPEALPATVASGPVEVPPIAGETAAGIVVTDPFSQTTFSLDTSLPETPAETAVYRYTPSTQVDVEAARQLAAQFGFTGQLYRESYATAPEPELAGFTPPPVYYAFDGSRTFSVDPWSANYRDDSVPYDYDNAADFETARQAAETFLRARGLLDFPYALQPGYGGDLFIRRQIDGLTMNQPEIVMGVNQAGQVNYVSQQRLPPLENIGTVALVPAEEAWAQLQAGVAAQNIPYTVYPPAGQAPPAVNPVAGTYQSWQRAYQAGEVVQLYGWPGVYLPVSGSGTARVQLFPWRLQGDDEVLNQIAEAVGQPITVEGVVGEEGQTVSINGWAVLEELEPMTPQGVIQRQGEEVRLETTDGFTYVLPGVPADVPDGATVRAFAWNSQQTGDDLPILQWESLETAVALDETALTADGSLPSPAYQAVSIEEVKLAYYQTLSYPETAAGEAPPGPPTVLLQPVWQFRGTADTGERIEFYVQAAAAG